MNKKFLSAALFGALMVSSTGTFVSCKDYDDDIDRIDNTLNDLKSQIAALQTEVANGNWVTSVTPTEGGFTVVFKDGNTYTIVNGKDGEKGDKGEDGKGTEVAVKDGYWYIDGEKTDYLAVTSEDLKEVKVPYISEEDGYWYFYNDKGEAEKSPYKAIGAAYAVNAGGVFTLYMPDANGVMQTIKLPTAASLISGINILDGNTKPTTQDQALSIKYWVHSNASADWAGPRGKIAAKSILYSAKAGDADICFNLDPSNVDATEMSFALINSQDGVAPLELVSPADYKELITRRSATYNNGIFTTGIGEGSKIFTYSNDESDFTSQLLKTSGNVIFALTPNVDGANVRSPYQIKVNTTKNPSATLTHIIITGVDNNANSYDWSSSLSTSGGLATIKVGVEAPVTAKEPYNLYDLYMTVTDAAKDKFGLLIDNEKRTIIATKSPDDLTDATFDLTVKVMDNAGQQYSKVVTVTVNRTMGESAYDKQEKPLTKLTDTFAVPAEPLFTSLAGKANDWKESVDLSKTKFELLQKNSAGDLVAATEGNSSFYGILDVANTVAPNGQANGHVAFLTSDNKIATPATLANIRFSFNIPTVAVNAPVKIGKEYYIRLTFKSKETSSVVLNTITVPFELSKPELNSILVKESGVFVDGNNLAHAYMNAVDAKWDRGEISSTSRYYIDRAFTNMYENLKKVGDYSFDIVTNDDPSKPSSYYAVTNTVVKTAIVQPDYAVRSYVELKNVDDNGDGIKDGYKRDLNVKFTGHYLAVQDDSYKYGETYQFRVMSPILEGEAMAANNVVEVSATGKTKIYREDIWAKTYNNDVKYDIFKNTNKWSRDDIRNVKFATGNVNVFQMVIDTPTNQVITGGKVTTDSYIEVEGVSENTAKLKVAITDIWGYTLNSSVDIKTTLNTGK